jgi:hypothetical protein
MSATQPLTFDKKLFSIIGKTLAAYLIGAKDTRAVDRLIEGELLSDDSQQRLRLPTKSRQS